MNLFSYLTALIVLFFYYGLGRFVTKKIAPNNIKLLVLKYYRIIFIIGAVLSIVVHIAFRIEGSKLGIPDQNSYTYGIDSYGYYMTAESILTHGFNTDAIGYYGGGGAMAYILLCAAQMLMFGSNPLILIFMNVLLYSLTIVLVGVLLNYFFDNRFIRKTLFYFSIYFGFYFYLVLPLKEALQYFLAILFILLIHQIKISKNKSKIVYLIIVFFLLFNTRPYVAGVLFMWSFYYLPEKISVKQIIALTVIFIGSSYLLFNYNIGGIGLSNLLETQNIYIGQHNAGVKTKVVGAKNIVGVLLSGNLRYLSLLVNQTIRTFLNPLFTSYPINSNLHTDATYLRAFINYFGCFVWYFLLPSIIHGTTYIIKKRKEFSMFLVPALLFFTMFMFVQNMLRYQMVTRFFWIIIGVYGLQYYSKWKKYLPFWWILYGIILYLSV